MKRTIKVGDKIYLIRGNYKVADLKRHYQGFVEKYKGTKTTFEGWLVGYGKVYCQVNPKR